MARAIHYIIPVFICLLASACANKIQATEYGRQPSYAIPVTANTTLAHKLWPLEKKNPGKSGFWLIPNGRDAFLMRIAMVEAAEKTIDLQYYSISNDATGQLLLESLLKAADRGVRVRVLVDDLNIKGADETVAVLNHHSHIEVRVFNPFATKEDSMLTRLNSATSDLAHFFRRMHNKAFIVDNQVAVAGGRNLGDEYFGFGTDFNFHDLDVLAGGPIVAEISKSYDKYWNSNEAYPICVMHPPELQKEKLQQLRANLQAHWRTEKEAGELRQLIPLADQIGKGNVKLLWAKAELAADDPSKIDQPVDENKPSKPEARLNKLGNVSQREFIIVSPYFIPGEDGTQWLKSMVKDGVKVRVLSNSLASTDVVSVHARYRAYRDTLVKSGVELYELKPMGGVIASTKGFRSGSHSSLHTKVYVIDRKELVMGSFNFDQRSENLNTELVLVIHSAELSQQVARLFEHIILPATSYRVTYENGHMLWTDEKGNIPISEDEDPGAGLWRRIKADVISLLPIDSQL